MLGIVKIKAQMFHKQIRSETVAEVGCSEWLAVHCRLDFVVVIKYNDAYIISFVLEIQKKLWMCLPISESL